MTEIALSSVQSEFAVTKEGIESELEVEQLLNDIGLFTDDSAYPEGQTPYNEIPKDSHEHASVSADEGEFSAPPKSLENMQTFSVPITSTGKTKTSGTNTAM